MTSELIAAKFGHRLRVRVNGILVENDRMLMVRHKGLGKMGHLWLPPGGGMEYGSSSIENLKREFLEETGIEVDVKQHLFTCEFIETPLHAIELFFSVIRKDGVIGKGFDPELEQKDQIMDEPRFLSVEDLRQLPDDTLHAAFRGFTHMDDLLSKRGYFLIQAGKWF